MEELELNMDTYLPLRDVVFHTLRDAILKGELKPGERLMEMHLAEKLGVSRTPIREAIRMLEKEGLAITIPRRGAQVAKMTEKDLEDVLEIRDALDSLAVTTACRRMNEENAAKLDEALSDFEKAVLSEDIRAIAEADENFHNVIYQITENPKLETIVANLREQMYRYRFEYLKDNSYYRRLTEEHREIVDGLKKKDRELVRENMHTHLMNQMDAVRQTIREME